MSNDSPAPNPVLPVGYSPLPPGHLANLVSFLEMTERPVTVRAPSDSYRMERMTQSDLGRYRALFRRVGEDWLWFSRLWMADETLSTLLTEPLIEAYALTSEGRDIGFLELDLRRPEECEIVYFGVTPDTIGKGVARDMMDRAIALAWARPIRRLWLHTCHFDHPRALGFYRSSGFKVYKFEVEVHPDPRLTGHSPPDAAPHVPKVG